MMSEFLNLPRNILNDICTFLDRKTLIQLREVSKQATAVVEFYANTIKVVMDELSYSIAEYRTYYEDELNCCIGDKRQSMLWKVSALSAIHILELPSSALKRQHCPNIFTASLNLEDMKRFVKTMKPFFAISEIKRLHIEFATSDVVRMFTELLEGITIPTVYVFPKESENIDIQLSLDLFENVRPECVITSGYMTKETTNFLIKMADYAKDITIQHFDQKPIGDEIDLISIIQEVLNKNCERLTLCFTSPNFVVSFVERLLQFLHQTNKKANLLFFTNMGPAHFQSGNYNVKIENGKTTIKHIEIDN